MTWRLDDKYTKLLLHMDGSNAGTTFNDEAGNTVTPTNATTSTAQYKFGPSSGSFTGSSSFLQVPDNNNWRLDDGSNSNQWTLDFWLRFNSVAATSFLNQGGSNDFWRFIYTGTNLQFRIRVGGVNQADINKAWTPSANTWYHVALVKQGTTGYKFFVDGSQIGTTTTDSSTIPNFSTSLRVGGNDPTGGNDLNGYLDEVRISKGIARWTANFTPPTRKYQPLMPSQLIN